MKNVLADIAATKMHEDDYTSQQALEKFRPFLKEHYPGKYQIQGRSWGIEVDDEVTLDLVPTSAPSEAEKNAMEWTKAASWDFPDEPEIVTANAYQGILLKAAAPYSRSFPLNDFQKQFTAWARKDADEFSGAELLSSGIGCWHPAFPARIDDVWMLAAVAARRLEEAVRAEEAASILVTFEQVVEDGGFQGVRRM